MSMLKLYYRNESMGKLKSSTVREDTTLEGKSCSYILHQLISKLYS